MSRKFNVSIAHLLGRWVDSPSDFLEEAWDKMVISLMGQTIWLLRGGGSGLEDSYKNLPVASQANKKKLMHCQLWQKEILHVLCSPPKIVQILHSSSLHVA